MYVINRSIRIRFGLNVIFGVQVHTGWVKLGGRVTPYRPKVFGLGAWV